MRKKSRKKRLGFFRGISDGLSHETKHSVLGIILIVAAIYFILSLFNLAGVAGDWTYKVINTLLGAGFFTLPLALVLLAISFFKSETPHIVRRNTIGGSLFLLSSLSLIHIIFQGRGGIVGEYTSIPFINFFGFVAGTIFLMAILLISILIVFDMRLPSISNPLSLGRKKTNDEEIEVGPEIIGEADESDYNAEEDTDMEHEDVKLNDKKSETKEAHTISTHWKNVGTYTPPPLSLFDGDHGKPSVGDIKANANIIKRTLQNFNINVEIDEISIGPSITRYAIKPAEGVRLSRIVALADDLALALAAHPVRIEAPIPGKSSVGIEIPNAKKSLVGLATLLSSKEYSEKTASLTTALGRGVTGLPVFSDLTKAPHMLIAGSTGSGKSVTIHAIVASLLYRNPPENLRFIMVDPKRVELTLYNGIPHQLTPVITDPKKAILALKWAIKEMERRYNILETESVRDISTYHRDIVGPELKKKRKDEENLPELMPYIVIVIDELADIMSVYPKELEGAIVRLAQMSRAIGIHLVLSTQRPSVNVITGLIKANISSRIALQVTSQIDSRTILDMAGAERLLGAGDMLYVSAEMSKPARLQSPFISETEVKGVVNFLKKHTEEYGEELDLSLEEEKNSLLRINLDEDDGSEEMDEMYEDARELVIATGKASTSYLQRKFGLGYARAARLMDMMEDRGVVGPAQGSKPREVLERIDDSYKT